MDALPMELSATGRPLSFSYNAAQDHSKCADIPAAQEMRDLARHSCPQQALHMSLSVGWSRKQPCSNVDSGSAVVALLASSMDGRARWWLGVACAWSMKYIVSYGYWRLRYDRCWLSLSLGTTQGQCVSASSGRLHPWAGRCRCDDPRAESGKLYHWTGRREV